MLEVGDAIIRLRSLNGFQPLIDAAVDAVERRDVDALQALDLRLQVLDAATAEPLTGESTDAAARSVAARTLVALRMMRAALADFAELPHAA